MNIDSPIITSLLDTDFYKMTMGAVVFHNFPNATVTYEFFNRGKTHFPSGFAIQLRKQIQFLTSLKYTSEEIEYLKGLNRFKSNYIEWLKNFQFDQNEVNVTQLDTGELKIFIKGSWYKSIYWEVPLMAIISELYFRMAGTEMSKDWADRIVDKSIALQAAGCKWSDFGTRRRRSFEVQNRVVATMKYYTGFIGTSNIHLAKKFGVTPIGTSAHEAVMAMAVFVGYENANNAWLNYWADYYDGELGIALPDTFGSIAFFENFNGKLTRLWDGLRQDSGDPEKWMDTKVIPHYTKHHVPTRDKKIVFGDNLNVEKAIKLHIKYNQLFNVIFGIGTFLTNDTFTDEQKVAGQRPLNMVIKLTSANFGKGWMPVVKLSDDEGKHTGSEKEIKKVKEILHIS
jgi:nicotinate phosphoribosyltransferase